MKMNDEAMNQDPAIIPQRRRFQAAMILAIIADALQIIVFPLFIEGAISPVGKRCFDRSLVEFRENAANGRTTRAPRTIPTACMSFLRCKRNLEC